MLSRRAGRHQATLGADKGYDSAGFVAALRAPKVTPHIAQNTSGRRSAIDRRTTRHPGYRASQRVRKRIEAAFGWIKTVAGLRKTRHRGTAGGGLTMAAVRLRTGRTASCPSEIPHSNRRTLNHTTKTEIGPNLALFPHPARRRLWSAFAGVPEPSASAGKKKTGNKLAKKQKRVEMLRRFANR
jgi:hypothetical protein